MARLFSGRQNRFAGWPVGGPVLEIVDLLGLRLPSYLQGRREERQQGIETIWSWG